MSHMKKKIEKNSAGFKERIVAFILAQFSFMKQVYPKQPAFPYGEEVG